MSDSDGPLTDIESYINRLWQGEWLFTEIRDHRVYLDLFSRTRDDMTGLISFVEPYLDLLSLHIWTLSA